MTNTRKIVKIFLASPGDLRDERIAAKSIVDEFNGMWAETLGYQIELVGWEDTISSYGRPQSIINKDLERCELFVGLIWKRWGTPPDICGQYNSGFEEEFETSVKRLEERGSPAISLFFKDLDEELLQDPGEQLQKVINFKNRIISEKRLLFESFPGVREFEFKFRRRVCSYVQQLIGADARAERNGEQTTSSAPVRSKNFEDVDSSALSVQALSFMREFISNVDRQLGDNSISAVDVARFRLLANVLTAQGNDNRSLGAHDANILFAERSTIVFGREEVDGLNGELPFVALDNLNGVRSAPQTRCSIPFIRRPMCSAAP